MRPAALRIRRTQFVLGGAVMASALAWALAGGLTVLGVTAMLDVVVGLARPLRELARPIAAAGASLAALLVAWRGRRVGQPERVALWIEERHPELRYALVTATDERYGDLPALARMVEGVQWGGTLRVTVWRAVLVPLALALVAATSLAVLPRATLSRVVDPRPGDVLDAPRREVDGLGPLVVTVTAPPYAAAASRTLENPVTVSGLVGARVTVLGAWRSANDSALGPGPSALGVRVDDSVVAMGRVGDRWSAAFQMPERPALLRVRGRGEERLIALEPVPDSVPVVALAAPLRDSVSREPTGAIAFIAVARDDLGLRDGWFEAIVSSGSGESFTFRSSRFGARSSAGRRDTLRAVIRLDTMALRAGDLVHVRGVARDRNDVTGPGVGVTETRTIRIARPDEYDSIAVITLPPLPADSALLSQRMLIMLTEAVVERLPRLARDTVVAESRSIGLDQARLRRRVAEILFMRLGGEEGEHAHGEVVDEGGGGGGEDLTPAALLRAAEAAVEEGIGEALDFHGDETPVVAINRPLLEAYNAMWEAGRELGIGEPARALPHMYAALEAIQRARAAERIYLRGRPPRVVVDLARVRLVGEVRDAEPAGRTGGPADRRTVLALRFDAIIESVGADPALADSLLVLRVAALDVDGTLAAALGEAAAVLRAGGDATDVMVRVRRLAGPPVRRSAGLSAWTEGWHP